MEGPDAMPDPPEHHSQIVDGSRVAPASVDLADAVVQGVRAGFGVLALGLGVALRTLGESPATVPRQAGRRIPASEVADILLGTVWGAARLSGRMAATGARIVAPMMSLVARPPLVPLRLQPAYRVQLMTEQWQRDRPETLRTLGRLSATAFPGVVDAVLDQVDVDQMATVVIDRVDLTAIASTALDRLDLNEVALKVLNQLDVNEVAVRLLNQLDTNEVVAQLLDELDIDEVATLALNELDLTQLVLDRVDLQRVVAGALENLDLTNIVVDQVDLGAVVGAALEKVDLTAVVVDKVDLGAVVAAALEKVDLTAIVMQQVDLVGVAEYVVDAIDLPEIIRDSTGSVASEAVVGMRMQGIDADAAVGRVVDRMLRRRRQHRTEQEPGKPDSPGRPDDPPTRTPT
jgi:hypothetical protein